MMCTTLSWSLKFWTIASINSLVSSGGNVEICGISTRAQKKRNCFMFQVSLLNRKLKLVQTLTVYYVACNLIVQTASVISLLRISNPGSTLLWSRVVRVPGKVNLKVTNITKHQNLKSNKIKNCDIRKLLKIHYLKSHNSLDFLT